MPPGISQPWCIARILLMSHPLGSKKRKNDARELTFAARSSSLFRSSSGGPLSLTTPKCCVWQRKMHEVKSACHHVADNSHKCWLKYRPQIFNLQVMENLSPNASTSYESSSSSCGTYYRAFCRHFLANQLN